MKIFNKSWVAVTAAVMLVFINIIIPSSHALLILVMGIWAEFLLWAVVSFAGLYSFTYTDGRQQQIRNALCRIVNFSSAIPLAWYHRMFIAGLICGAGWNFTSFIYVLTVAISELLKDKYGTVQV
ncbi:DNZ54_00345 family protein [Pantoea sp. App145]|uniref:DNZ54_00345 family protein n=1 Tax=Pantoea sp. App145 TaxID=3071567 RepID=UPI003A80C7D4